MSSDFMFDTTGRQGADRPGVVVAKKHYLLKGLVVPLAVILGGELVKANPREPSSHFDASPPTPVDQSTSTSPRSGFGDGVYRVGVDIDLGTYRSSGVTGSNGGYWERLRDATGVPSSRISNYFGHGPAYVTLDEDGEYFRSEGCGTWTRVPGQESLPGKVS